MLEVHGLTKVYKPKKGVPVLAVDHINLKFPDKGMVFLLGKSGSGKSTMLNLLGGLDKYDEGEIIIKGKSSKDFKQRDFDSYRNTYLGFIFQEYNILEEFNVGANIALALELQGQKATDEKINQILAQVDLAGYGQRKPNELSGGQKQRVAIARALVKDPEIIMADEPTGALDSNTGRQILDTLKKLSEDKLVIVVSHDREFAEAYADRIIELADGHVISDMEYFKLDEGEEGPKLDQVPKPGEGLVFNPDAILIAPSYHLTEEDRLAINAWMDQRQGGGMMRIFHRPGATAEQYGRKAVPTDESRIVAALTAPFCLIRSKLPLKNAFKIGASGLKHKKFRLVVTIFLSCVSFGLFGLSDTMGSYDHVRTCADSIADSNITYATFAKEVLEGNSDYSYWYGGYNLSDADVEKIEEDTGIQVIPVYVPIDWDDTFEDQYDSSANFSETDYHIYAYGIQGLATVTQDILDDMGFDLVAGRLPEGDTNEIAITSYEVETFKIGGYKMPEDTVYQTITEDADMLGKVLVLGNTEYTIVGVVDTHFDLDRYKDLTVDDPSATTADTLIDYALASEINNARYYSLLQVGLVGEGHIDTLLEGKINASHIKSGWYDLYYEGTEEENYSDFQWLSAYYLTTLSEVDRDQIVWVDDSYGKLSSNEVVISYDLLLEIFGSEETAHIVENGFTDDEKKMLDSFQLDQYVDSASNSVVSISVDTYTELHIVGYLTEEYSSVDELVVVDNATFKESAMNDDGDYQMAIGVMPESQRDIRSLVKYCMTDEDGDGVRYTLENSVTYELDGLDEVFKILSRIFLGIGIFFAVFASILMATFISSSISYKKQEIGILRAIGARGSDVFRIFFSESFIISMINFVLSTLATFGIVSLINHAMRKSVGLLVNILTFGIRQVLLLLVVSLAVAAIASFFPVNHNARKKPIDAIRNR